MDDSALNARFAEIDGRFRSLEDLIRSEGAATRRQLDVVAGMQSDIRMLSEGHGALVENIAEVKGGMRRLEAGQISLVLRTSALESRLTGVEKTQKVMLAELRGLASRR